VNDRVALLGVGVSAALLVTVLELVRRRRLTEEYSFIWILASLALLALSFSRRLMEVTALWLGVFYPPALLLLALLTLVVIALLYFTVVASRQRTQIERLVEEVSILAAEVRDLQQKLSERQDVPQ
jgi:amino acid transporter